MYIVRSRYCNCSPPILARFFVRFRRHCALTTTGFARRRRFRRSPPATHILSRSTSKTSGPKAKTAVTRTRFHRCALSSQDLRAHRIPLHREAPLALETLPPPRFDKPRVLSGPQRVANDVLVVDFDRAFFWPLEQNTRVSLSRSRLGRRE